MQIPLALYLHRLFKTLKIRWRIKHENISKSGKYAYPLLLLKGAIFYLSFFKILNPV